MTIKAIETVYKGYRFRSRLEARWAVFFDELHINWQYEPQGYEIDVAGTTRRYLPDFYLPDWGLWCEVKGDEDALDPLVLAFAAHPASGLPASPEGESVIREPGQSDPEACWPWLVRRILVLGPVPEADDLKPIRFHPVLAARPVGEKWAIQVQFLAFSRVARPFPLVIDYPGFIILTEDLQPGPEIPNLILTSPYLVYGLDTLESVYTTARQARFEHGQSGALS